MPDLPIRLVRETASTITLGWEPPPGQTGYIATLDGDEIISGKRRFSFDDTASEVRIGKRDGDHKYGVLILGTIAQGEYHDTPIPEPPKPVLRINASGLLTWDPTPGATTYNLWDSGATPQYIDVGNVTSYQTTARPGHTDEFDIQPRKDGVIVGDWYGRVERKTPGTPAPDPDPTPLPTGEQIIVIETAGWGGSLFRELKAAGIGFHRNNAGGWNSIGEAKAAGMTIATTVVGESGTLGAISPAQYATDLRALVLKHGLTRVEVLNEPEGDWFWTDAGNATAVVRILKASKEALVDTGCKLLHSVQPKLGYDDKIIAAGGLQYIDEPVVHPYGGAYNPPESAKGNRQMVINAFNKCGGKKKIAITEVGWPTAVGQPSTGDSLQWREDQQAANIVDFCKWVRANPQMISMMSLFHYVDYGTSMWYGIVRKDLSHKPSFSAFAPWAND